MDVADGNGLHVNSTRLAILHFQRCAERRRVLKQQPVSRRNEGVAARVEQRPGDDSRENIFNRGGGQQFGERSFCFARGEFTGGGEKIFWRTSDLFGEPAPVESVHGFDGNDLIHC